MKVEDCKILVVDDVDEMRSIYVELLEAYGFPVFSASNGLEALQIFKNHGDIELVISDVRMPECDGIELLKALRALDPKKPIVCMVSGQIGVSNETTANDLFNLGANQFYYKPVNLDKILKYVNDACKLEDFQSHL